MSKMHAHSLSRPAVRAFDRVRVERVLLPRLPQEAAHAHEVRTRTREELSRSLLHPPLRDTESPSVDYVHQGMSRPVASPGGGRRRAGLSPRSARDRRSGGGAQVGAPLQFMDGLEDLVGIAEDGSLRDLLGVVSDERARGQRGASVASTVVLRRAARAPLEDVQAMDRTLGTFRHVVDRARGLA